VLLTVLRHDNPLEVGLKLSEILKEHDPCKALNMWHELMKDEKLSDISKYVIEDHENDNDKI
jgi:hypothetical protein